MILIKYLISALIFITMLFSPIISSAQYGGGVTIISGGSSSSSTAPVVSSSVSGNSVILIITSAKKGDVINIVITNSNNDVVNISFTVNADISNASITLTKIDPSQALPGLPATPTALFSLTLVNLTYEQLTNFSFDFAITGLPLSYSGFSSNSPWAAANVSIKTAATSSTSKTVYTGSSAIAFKQFAIIPTSNLPTTSTTTNTASTTATSNVNTTASNADLIRTGEMSTPVKFTLSVLTVLLAYGLIFIVFRSNKKHN